MREIIAELFVSLDNYAKGSESPAYFGFDGPGLQNWINAKASRPCVQLMGRRTWEMFAPMVAGASDEASQRMTDLPKVVVSSTLSDLSAWPNSTLLSGDLAADIAELRHDGDDPVRTIGSVSLVQSLLRLDLIDRLRLVVFPVVLGDTGREPLFASLPDLHLDLLSCDVLDDRLLALDYRPRVHPGANS